nr:MAG TPA: hypothetical protein [Caudoviricetes sp.]DAM22781.1 MAG TPA: hypothetical protein [Caudoviricetes sp.]
MTFHEIIERCQLCMQELLCRLMKRLSCLLVQ